MKGGRTLAVHLKEISRQILKGIGSLLILFYQLFSIIDN